MSSAPFGFHVGRSGVMGTYSVYLPQQPTDDCWEIVFDAEPEYARSELVRFIAEASRALEALEQDIRDHNE